MAFNLKQVLKALLFSSSRPLSLKEIQDVFTRFHEADMLFDASGGDAPPDDAASRETAVEVPSTTEAEADSGVPALITTAQIREALDEIIRELHTADDVYQIVEAAQGFRIVTHPRFARWIRALRDEPPPMKLSPSAMETLAVIAYRQPVTRAEIEHIRGVSAEAGVAKLLERELIYVVGRADLPGRPIQYGTTEAFLEFVGIRSVEELPATDVLSRQQINDWLQSAMKATHPSDRDMGLEEEGEEQLSLDDAARSAEAAKAGAAPESAPAAPGDAVPPASTGPETPPPA